MRYAVIDNSTLTAVERLLGKITVSNLHAIEGDVAAFENLVQTILFYDKIFYVDDYKEQYRGMRQQSFSYLTPIPTSHIAYDALLRKSSELTDGLTFGVRAGTVEPGDFARFLDLLKMSTTFTWDQSSSDWFLTLKMLQRPGSIPVEKYSVLHEMIRSEKLSNTPLDSPPPAPSIRLVGTDGHPIAPVVPEKRGQDGVSQQLMGFISSLNWLAQRTAFYATFASNYSADAVLHPIRSAFLVSMAGRLGIENGNFSPVIDLMAQRTQKVVLDVRSNVEPAMRSMELPIFSAWIVNKVRDPRSIIDEAHSLRQSDLFVKARAQLIELEDALRSSDRTTYVKRVNQISQELDKTASSIRRNFSVESQAQFSTAPLISAFNWISQAAFIPEIDIKLPIPKQLDGLTHRRGFQGVLKSVAHDLIAVERLGATFELLTSQVRRDPQARKYDVKVEDWRFHGKESHWKRPM